MNANEIRSFRNPFAMMVSATRPPWATPAFAIFQDYGNGWEFHRFHIDYEASKPWDGLLKCTDKGSDVIALVAEYRPQNCRATQYDAFQLGRYTGLLGIPVWDFLIVDDQGGFVSVCDAFPELRDSLFCKHCGHYDVEGYSEAGYQPLDPKVEWGTILECHEIHCEAMTNRMAEMPQKDREDLLRWRREAAAKAEPKPEPKLTPAPTSNGSKAPAKVKPAAKESRELQAV